VAGRCRCSRAWCRTRTSSSDEIRQSASESSRSLFAGTRVRGCAGARVRLMKSVLISFRTARITLRFTESQDRSLPVVGHACPPQADKPPRGEFQRRVRSRASPTRRRGRGRQTRPTTQPNNGSGGNGKNSVCITTEIWVL